MLFSKFILLSSSLAGVGGYMFMRRENKYKKIYNDLSYDLIPQYEFSQVLETDDLPKGNSFIILKTVTQIEKGQPFYSYFEKNDKLITSSKPFIFTISNPSGCELEISNKQQETIFFNLQRGREEYSHKDLEKITGKPLKQSIVQKYLQKNSKFVKRSITDGDQYAFIGSLNNTASKLTFRPKIVIAGDVERFTYHLDKFLVENNKRGKICFGICAGLVLSHILVARVLFPQHFRKAYRSGPSLTGQNNYEQQ